MSDHTSVLSAPLPVNSPASVILDRAADLIEARGWDTGVCGWNYDDAPTDDTKPLCLEGALMAALGLTFFDLCSAEDGFDIDAFYAARPYAAIAEHVDQDPTAGGLWFFNDGASGQDAITGLLRTVAVIEAARETAVAVTR